MPQDRPSQKRGGYHVYLTLLIWASHTSMIPGSLLWWCQDRSWLCDQGVQQSYWRWWVQLLRRRWRAWFRCMTVVLPSPGRRRVGCATLSSSPGRVRGASDAASAAAARGWQRLQVSVQRRVSAYVKTCCCVTSACREVVCWLWTYLLRLSLWNSVPVHRLWCVEQPMLNLGV